MVEKAEIRREAKERQGTILESRRGKFLIEGDQSRARFQFGAEGLVQPAVEQRTGKKYRIKVFWEPDDTRLERSRSLAKRGLASPDAPLDVLAGAPFAILDSLGGSSRFAVIMKNVEGASWKDLLRDAEYSPTYPPSDWPSFRTRWLWAFGLASAVGKMEALNFVHADLSDGNIVGVKDGSQAGGMALVDFDAYFNPEYPSNYLGTSGFVAPEIWEQGAVGVGSDRLAMAILIQEFLLVGDPELSATEAFQIRYTQDQICALECTAHPLLRRKYPAIAELLDKTLKAPSRGQRPSPMEWREALRSLHRPGGTKVFRVTGTTGEPDLQMELRPGESRDLEPTPFGIHADLLLRESLRVRPHPGSTVLIRPVDGTWQELRESSEVEISPSSRLFDRAGKMQAQVLIDPSAGVGSDSESLVTPDSIDAATNRAPGMWSRLTTSIGKTNWKKVGVILAILLTLILVFLALRFLVLKNGQVTTSKEPPPVQEPSTSRPPTDTGHVEIPPVANPTDTSPESASPSNSNPSPGPDENGAPQHVTAAPSLHSEPAGPADAADSNSFNSNTSNAASGLPASSGAPALPPPDTTLVPSETVSSEITKPAETAKPTVEPNVYRGPPSGDFVWSGTVPKNQFIEITSGTPVSGQPLPGVPVSIAITNNRVAVVTQPNPLNHFSTIVFHSKSSGQIAIGVHWVVLPVN